MIIYDDRSWFNLIFAWTGSVFPAIWPTMVFWVILVLLSTFILQALDWRLGSDEHSMLGGTTSFLLIFRARQAYARYWEGRTLVTQFFNDMRDFMMYSLMHVRGGTRNLRVMAGDRNANSEDKNDQLAREFRVDAVRLGVALAVVLKSHTRLQLDGFCFGSISKDTKWELDWDRFRLRQLLRDFEFRIVDASLGKFGRGGNTTDAFIAQFKDRYEEGPPDDWPDEFPVDTAPKARAHLAVGFFIKELLMENMNDAANGLPHGLKERLVPPISNLIKSAMISLEGVSVIMSTPLPLPYACLCKLLLTVWMASYPFVEDAGLGVFGSIVVPIVIMVALLGIDSISTELENPFGDDANDLDLLELISTLECEAMTMLELSGDARAMDRFAWRRLPHRIREMSCKPIHRMLTLTELAAPDLVPDSGTPRMTPRMPRPLSPSKEKGPPRSYSGTALE